MTTILLGAIAGVCIYWFLAILADTVGWGGGPGTVRASKPKRTHGHPGLSVYRTLTRGASGHRADLLVVPRTRGLPVALAQLDPMDFDDPADGVHWYGGSPADVQQVFDDALEVALYVAGCEPGDTLNESAVERARRSHHLLRYILGDEPQRPR